MHKRMWFFFYTNTHSYRWCFNFSYKIKNLFSGLLAGISLRHPAEDYHPFNHYY